MSLLKTTLSFVFIGTLTFTLAACGDKEPAKTEPKVAANQKDVIDQAEEMSQNVDHAKPADSDMKMADNVKPVVVAQSEKGIIIEDATVKSTIPGQKASSAYLLIKNTSDTDIEAVSIKSNVSDLTEFHSMEMKDSKMYMRKMEKVIIPAKGELLFSQASNHIMIMKLQKPLEVGNDVQFNLTFDNGETLEFTAPVKDKDSMEKSGHKANSSM